MKRGMCESGDIEKIIRTAASWGEKRKLKIVLMFQIQV